MSFVSTLRHVLAEGGADLDRKITNTEGQVLKISEDVATAETDYLIACAVDISQLKAVIIVADGGDVTLETNDGTVPDDTFSLLDGVPLVWSVDYLALAGIFTADITALYVTNASGETVTLTAWFIVDPTV